MKGTRRQRRATANERQAAARSATTFARERAVTVGALLLVVLPLAFMNRSESSQYMAADQYQYIGLLAVCALVAAGISWMFGVPN